MLVRVQPLRDKGEANSAHMETNYQNEAGNTGESEIKMADYTAPW